MKREFTRPELIKHLREMGDQIRMPGRGNNILHEAADELEHSEGLGKWLNEQAKLADLSSHEWTLRNLSKPAIISPQAAYRAGEWFAYRNVLNYLTGANYV